MAIFRTPGIINFPCPTTEGKTSNMLNKSYRLKILSNSLDNIIKTYKLPPPDYMKVDCDAPMLDHLLSSPKTLENLQGLLIEEKNPKTIKGFKLVGTYIHKSKEINYIFEKI